MLTQIQPRNVTSASSLQRAARTRRVAGISFDQMHQTTMLEKAVALPDTRIVALCEDNPANQADLAKARAKFGIGAEDVFADPVACIEASKPDMISLCVANGRHADFVEKLAPFRIPILVEKPFAPSLAEADRMIAATRVSGTLMAINWPLGWVPSHVTAKRLISEGRIGQVIEVHYFDGNRGPIRYLMDEPGVTEEIAIEQARQTWWYQKEQGGGSLIDYAGYGYVLGTWFMDGQMPEEVSALTWTDPRLEVDEHSITICRYERGLSKFETRWGTFTSPWEHQPQPKCGFVIVGTAGTIASYDYEPTIRVQTLDRPEGDTIPVDDPLPGLSSPLENFFDVIENGAALHGPLTLEINRSAQRIMEAAQLSVRMRRPILMSEVP